MVRPSANAVNTSANTRHASGRRARAGDIARGGRRARAETSGHGARGGSLRDAHARSSDARRAGPKIGIRWNSAPRAGVSTHRQFGRAPRRDGGAASVSAAFDAVRRAAWPHSRPGASLGERLASARLAGGASSSSSSHANLPSSPGGRTGGRFAPDASEVVDVDAARARREFADGGPAVCRLTSPTGAHGVFATWQPPTPRPGSRVYALTLARETHGARVDIGVGPGAGPTAESSPDRARPDQAAPTAAPYANDPPARSPLLHPGGDGGVSFESNHAFGEGACVAQAQILSNLGGFDDATFAARCTLPERNHRRRNENSWTSRLRDATWGTSPRGDGDGDGTRDGSSSAPSTPGFTLAAASGRHGVRVAPRGLFRGPNRRARAEKTSRGRTARRASTVRATRHARRGVRV